MLFGNQDTLAHIVDDHFKNREARTQAEASEEFKNTVKSLQSMTVEELTAFRQFHCDRKTALAASDAASAVVEMHKSQMYGFQAFMLLKQRRS